MMTMATMTLRTIHGRSESSDLSARVARGEAGAFEELINCHGARVARLAHRLLGWEGDVEDVVQEVFLAALEKAGTFKGDASLWTWLTIITLNRCRSQHRRRKVMRRALRFLPLIRAEHAAADQGAVCDETASAVRAAVAALRPIDREVIVLFYLEQKSIAQICELLGASSAAVEVRLHRARRRLRITLKDFIRE